MSDVAMEKVFKEQWASKIKLVLGRTSMKHLALLERCGSKKAKPVTAINRTERDQAKSSTDLLIVLQVQFYQQMPVLSILKLSSYDDFTVSTGDLHI